MDFIFIILSAVLSLSSAAEVVPLRGSFCLGEAAEWTCTANNSLRWRNQPIGSSFPLITLYDATDSYNQPERDLGSEGPIRVLVTSLRGTEYLSRARVNMDSSLNGTRLECAGSGESFGLVNATVDLTVTEPVVISYLVIQFMSRNTMVLEWGGAQCVSYYIIEVNGSPVGTTTQTSYIYQRNTNGDTLTFTVHGVDFTGNNFTNITETKTGPIFNTTHILADNTLYIVTERDDADQLPIRSCNLTFDSESYNCSGMRVASFNVTPGEHSLSVVMSNDVGSSVYGTTVTVDPSPTMSSSFVCSPTPDSSPCPSCPPAPPCPPFPCKLPLWAIIVMIVLGVLLVLAVVFYIWKLWWRHRCCCRKCFCEDEDCCCQNCCCQGCWDAPFWTYFFCECFKKDNKRVATATANLRTTSPDEKDMMSSIEKDTSKM